jgi:hypothetical protein
VTNDADVIVMLGSLDDFSNTFVFCKSSRQNEVLSIGKLIDLHTNEVGTTLNPGLDFTAVNIMMGNDYLPKINFVTFEKLWRSYKQVAAADTKGLILNDKLLINEKFLEKLLFGIIKQTKPYYIKRLSLQNTFHPLYRNYMDGFTWCVHTYFMGECVRYNYMYGFQDSPHPLGLIFNIFKYPELLQVSNETFKPIDPDLYAILVLPKASLCLINKKYTEFAKQNKILYDEECCEKCNHFHDKLKDLNEKVINDKENVSYRKQVSITSKNMTLHKKQHDCITLADIEEIINNFDRFVKSRSERG